MPTQEVAESLTPYGLLPPDLEMLRPTVARYTSVMMQPSGPIFASQHRIGTFDVDTATAKTEAFLALARARGAHLAIIPEYFMPWTALQKAIEQDVTPADDALWVLGSESITEGVLEQFKQDVRERCVVIHEPWEGLATDRNLLDPVVLLFQAKRVDGTSQLVALVQFKTFPSRDDLFLEEGWLRRGTLIYRFRGATGQLTAAVIICSDAFALDDTWLADFNDRATLIHIQLNPSPRNIAYRHYRTTTFGNDARATSCHIICLNWAQSIVEHGDNGAPGKPWNNIASSTWYCPVDDCSPHDAVVIPNHNLGLYYVYMTERRHALLFHYDEAVFEILVPKLLTVGAAALANRNGPTAVRRYVWDAVDWSVGTVPESGFSAFIADNLAAQTALQHVLANQDPLAVERILALNAGMINGSPNWHTIKEIDSCQIGPDEVVRRMTVVQDATGNEFRHNRLNTAAQIHREILNAVYWPPQVTGVDATSILQWNNANPNFNVLTAADQPTLIVYLGDLPSAKEKETKADMFYDLLRKAGGPHQKRLCIMYREFGQPKFARIDALTRFDDAMEDKTEFLAVPLFDDTEAPHE
jgi:predicted amidohydrolase